MLSPSERREWGTSEGAEYEFPPGRLRMNGVAPEGKKIMGVVSFAGWTPPWHDVVLDLEFTILSGRFELYLRYLPTRRWYQLDFGPDAGYELNKPHQVTLRVKGSTVEMIAPDQPLQTGQIDLRTSRTGGVGFGLPPGGEIVLSSCKIKVLRPRS
jgi:hypothetical protein